ncbi:helix-turn-helix domain-containing protein [Flavobacterium hibernum]|uniref:XRE family transcriptional regulator n=1 Tax=Flavobacterium hibernum TaxID=37752 RepID=A0A0D0EE61_9FLAO|nr:XRE family transcriptional regulator [Flavobacterium hibernum]KIO51794.1 XRE family transcriptional regulator [Flavobacterium hibernum]OXA91832.1 XRE family transcriptional regulator [Flavobacterium hibernum]
MEGAILLEISKRIKQYRTEKGFTVQELADLSDVSKGMISQIENGRSIPSLSVLLGIVSALQVNLSDFFKDISPDEEMILIKRKGDYEHFQKEGSSGFSYERFLTRSIKNSTVDIVFLTIEPDNYREQVSTDAFEYKYILSGEVQYIIGNDTYTLNEGDSLFFDGRLMHVPINKGKKPVRMLIIYFFDN